MGALLAAPVPAALAVDRVVFERGPQDRPSLWSISPDGGHAAKIVAYGQMPAISPDGARVAFVRRPRARAETTNLYLRSLPGRVRLLAKGLEPPLVWSPDSRTLAAHTPRGRLVLVDTITGARRVVSRVVAYRPSFSPDGAHVAFTRPVGRQGRYQTTDIFRAPVSGGRAMRLTFGGRAQEPVWGPQGIFFARVLRRYPDANSVDIRLIPPEGGAATVILRVGAGEFGGVSPWQVSADGSHLLGLSFSLVSAPPVAVNIGTGRAIERGGAYDVGAALSADGSEILVTRRRGDTLNGRIAVVPFDSGRSRVLAVGREPSWNR